MAGSGSDTHGKKYDNLDQMWKEELGSNWYGKSLEYWKATEASLDGVLGGQAHVDECAVVALIPASPIGLPRLPRLP
eukprot:gene4536-822_t